MMMQSLYIGSRGLIRLVLVCAILLVQLICSATMQGSSLMGRLYVPKSGAIVDNLYAKRLCIRGGGNPAEKTAKEAGKQAAEQKSSPKAATSPKNPKEIMKTTAVTADLSSRSNASASGDLAVQNKQVTLDDYRAVKQPLRLAVSNLTLRDKHDEAAAEPEPLDDSGVVQLKAKEVRNVENLKWWEGSLKDKENERRAMKRPVHGNEFIPPQLPEIGDIQVKDRESRVGNMNGPFRAVIEDNGEGGRVREKVATLLAAGQNLGEQTAGAHTMSVPLITSQPAKHERHGNGTWRNNNTRWQGGSGYQPRSRDFQGGYRGNYTGYRRPDFQGAYRGNNTGYRRPGAGAGNFSNNRGRGQGYYGRDGNRTSYMPMEQRYDVERRDRFPRNGSRPYVPYNRAPQPPGQGNGTAGNQRNGQWRGGSARGRGGATNRGDFKSAAPAPAGPAGVNDGNRARGPGDGSYRGRGDRGRGRGGGYARDGAYVRGGDGNRGGRGGYQAGGGGVGGAQPFGGGGVGGMRNVEDEFPALQTWGAAAAAAHAGSVGDGAAAVPA